MEAEEQAVGGVHVCTHLGGVIRGGYPDTEQEGAPPNTPRQVHALLHTPGAYEGGNQNSYSLLRLYGATSRDKRIRQEMGTLRANRKQAMNSIV